MTIAEERYEKAWNSFLIYLNHQRFYYTDDDSAVSVPHVAL